MIEEKSGLPNPTDDLLHEIVAKIAEMADSTDPDDRNIQWIEGYSRACGDIVLLICRKAQALRAKKS